MDPQKEISCTVVAIDFDSDDESQPPVFFLDGKETPRGRRSDSHALFFFILGCFAFVAALLLASHCPN